MHCLCHRPALRFPHCVHVDAGGGLADLFHVGSSVPLKHNTPEEVLFGSLWSVRAFCVYALLCQSLLPSSKKILLLIMAGVES